jgi:hypothetical protein
MLQSLSPNNGQLPSLPRPHELVGSTADGSGLSVPVSGGLPRR